MYTTIIGNVGEAPELKYLNSGVAVTNFSVAQQQRRKVADGVYEEEEPLWLRINVWRGLAENVAESVDKGTRVIVSGRLRSRVWEDADGDSHTVLEMEAEEVGIALRFATVPTITKSTPTGEKPAPAPAPAAGKAARTAANVRKYAAKK